MKYFNIYICELIPAIINKANSATPMLNKYSPIFLGFYFLSDLN